MNVKELQEKFSLWEEGGLPLEKMQIYLMRKGENRKITRVSIQEKEEEIFVLINSPIVKRRNS